MADGTHTPEVSRRIHRGGRVVGSIRLTLNQRAGLTYREAERLAEALAAVADFELERME